MKAVKCDRCGKYFEADHSYLFGKAGNYRVVEYYINSERSSNPFEKEVDLCDDCQKALRMFMNGRKENEECPF